MTTDIFDYWAGVPADALVHPHDRSVLSRARHGFNLNALPNPYFGPLRTAPLVLLYLGPGLRDYDVDQATAPAAQAYFAGQRSGTAALPSATEYPPTHEWLQARVAQFGVPYDNVRTRIAVLNICPYRAREFDNRHMLAALPSWHVCLQWAQSTLFPQAESGERVVVCLRAARYWGLADGQQYGLGLFAPDIVRSGTMQRGSLRDAVVRAVCAALA